MKQFLLVIAYCLLLPWCGKAQNMVKFETGGYAHYCPNPSFNFFVNDSSLTVSNTGGAWCDSITIELQVHNFHGPGTYSLALFSGNYGFYNPNDSPPGMQTPTFTGDPGGGTVTVTRYDSLLGILEGTFSMVVSYHMYDTTDLSTVAISNGYFSFGTCYTVFHVAPDLAVPHHWFLYYQLNGIQPVSISFNWGDGTTTTGNTSHTYSTAGNYNICMHITDNAGCTATYCDSSTYIYKTDQVVDMTPVDRLATGIDEPVGEGRLKIYPNPATDVAIMQVDDSFYGTTALITDMAGRQLAKIPVTSSPLFLQTANLSEGLYLVSIGRFTGKLVVAR